MQANNLYLRSWLGVVLLPAILLTAVAAGAEQDGRIRPYSGNPFYWQYQGQPVLLLGGSKDDNLFQIPDLKEHLDEIVSVGANYIRNTMSDRLDRRTGHHCADRVVGQMGHARGPLETQSVAPRQQRQSHARQHLYCISNEIHPQYPPEWGWYWADYLRKQALAAGRGIEVTEMFWSLDLKAEPHRASLDRPEVYSYFEASQNSGMLDPEENWNHLQFVYQRLGSRPRPINNTKIYGADGGSVWAGSTQNAQEKFWRNILGGSASSRFHRPPTGLGLSEAAKAHIKSLRMLTDAMNVFTCEPRNDLFRDRSANEAYCLAEPGKQYAVYFPDGGAVRLDVSAANESLQVRWLDISRGTWQDSQTVESGGTLELKAPGKSHWAALVLVQQ